MTIITAILFTAVLLLLPSAALANPMVGPADITILLIFPLLFETGVVLFMLRNSKLRLGRFGPFWFLVNLISFLSYVYSVELVRPYLQTYVGPLFPRFAGEVVVIIGEGTLLYFFTKLSWFRNPDSQNVSLLRSYCASFFGNAVSVAGPFLHFLPFMFLTYAMFWPTLIPVFLLVFLFIIFVFLKKRGHLESRLLQIGFLGIILIISGVIISLSLSGNFSLPTREIRGTMKHMSMLTVNPSPSDLKDSDKNVRWQASLYLGMRPNPNNVQPLIDLLSDTDPEVRGLAAQSLGLMRDNRAVEPLIKALKDADPFAKEWAVRALGQLKDRRAIEPLRELINSESDKIRQIAEGALSEIERPESQPTAPKEKESPKKKR
jgi:hypothetical protein